MSEEKQIAAPRITGLTREKIVHALAVGQSDRHIAETNGHSTTTIRAVKRSDQTHINAVKERLAVQASQIATAAGRRIRQHLRANTLPVHLLPTTYGISVDKMLALRGEGKSDVGLTLNLLNLTSSGT